MATTLAEKLNSLPKARKHRIETRTLELLSEMTMKELRKASDVTQQELAELLKTRQEGISRMENREDILLSTLRTYVEGLGGTLHIVAEFPDRPLVKIGK